MSGNVQPVPPRYRWLNRLSVALLLFIVALIVVRQVTLVIVQRRLDKAIADIRAKGEPILAEDLVVKPLANDQNIAYFVDRACQDWPRVNGQLISQTDWFNEPDKHPDPVTDDAAYLASCEPALEHLRKAMTLTQSQTIKQWTRPLLNIMLPKLGQYRQLANAMKDATARMMRIGDQAGALNMLTEMGPLVRMFDPSESFLIHHLVKVSIAALRNQQIENVLPQVLVDKACAVQLKALSANLETPEYWRHSLREAMVKERAMGVDVFRLIQDNKSSVSQALGMQINPVLLTVGRPLVIHDEVSYIRAMTMYVDLVTMDKGPTRDKLVEALRFENEDLQHHPYDRTISCIVMPALDAVILRNAGKIVANTEMTRVAIAMKLYTHDHGDWPATLDALVPDYLDAVPSDPMANDVRPITYKVIKDKTDGQPLTEPIRFLYSVGTNEIDEGGKVHSSEFDSSQSWSDEGDKPFWLTPRPTPSEAQDAGIVLP
ncbi:MAG: hypothetical protein GC164_16360 [Phycisphaera sp.]|nr:hypothetical protein [Phycisphaera sp.]